MAEQKRSQFKERGRSMNSTGSGKSSTVSRSVYLASLQSDSLRFLQEVSGREEQKHRGLLFNFKLIKYHYRELVNTQPKDK